MRQMDTILVAIGVPTKEVPGASFALPQPAAVTEGAVDIPDQTTKEQQENMTQNPADKAETCSQKSNDCGDVAETEEMGDGWDIPDISDLLDSLNETETEGQISVRNNVSLTNNATFPDLNAQCDNEEEADNEHVSWSWNDTHWTTEH